MSTNSCDESLKEGSGTVVSHGFLNLSIRVSSYQKNVSVYGILDHEFFSSPVSLP